MRDKTALLRALMQLAAEENLAELTIADGEGSISILRERPAPAPAPAAAPEPEPALPANAFTINTPLTGIFYRSPEPGSEPYVHEGDSVAAGQTVGLVEAMKVFNEIASPQAGRVIAIKAGDGMLVQENQVLLVLERAASRR